MTDPHNIARRIAARLNHGKRSGSAMRGLFWLDGMACLHSVDTKTYATMARDRPHRMIGVYVPPVEVEDIEADLIASGWV